MIGIFVYACEGQCQSEPSERMTVLKAGLINGISSYVTWPMMADNEALMVCILAKNDGFSESLKRFYQQKQRNTDREMHIEVVSVDRIKHCHLVVLLEEQNRHSAQLLLSIGKSPILTISDDPQFTANGGHISFFKENNKLRFEINYQATIDSGLKVSSRLLKLARVINKQ